MTDWWSFNKSIVRETLSYYVAIGVMFIALLWTAILVRFASDVGVWPVALAALATAVAASFAGATWWRPLMYGAVPVTWLAMATLFIERTIHFGLGVGLAVGLWLLANLLAGVAAAFRSAAVSGSARHRTLLLFHTLFVVWPATGLLFVERGAALDLNRWAVIAGWLLLSVLALLAYLLVLGKVVESQTPGAQQGGHGYRLNRRARSR